MEGNSFALKGKRHQKQEVVGGNKSERWHKECKGEKYKEKGLGRREKGRKKMDQRWTREKQIR